MSKNPIQLLFKWGACGNPVVIIIAQWHDIMGVLFTLGLVSLHCQLFSVVLSLDYILCRLQVRVFQRVRLF